MEFVLAAPTRAASSAHSHSSGDRQPFSPSKQSSSLNASASSAASLAVDRLSQSDSTLRSQYNDALRMHANGELSLARAAYDDILEALSRTTLQHASSAAATPASSSSSAASAASSASPSKRPPSAGASDPIDALAGRMRDPFDELVPSTRVRLRMREVVRKNRGRVEEELCEQQETGSTARKQAAEEVAVDAMQIDQPASSASTTAASSGVAVASSFGSSSSHSSPLASLSVSLSFYLSALTAAEATLRFENRLVRWQREEGLLQEDEQKSSSGGGGGDGAPSASVAVSDGDLLQRIARVAGRLRQYSLQRQALERGTFASLPPALKDRSAHSSDADTLLLWLPLLNSPQLLLFLRSRSRSSTRCWTCSSSSVTTTRWPRSSSTLSPASTRGTSQRTSSDSSWRGSEFRRWTIERAKSASG
jgi:hypothetical protein